MAPLDASRLPASLEAVGLVARLQLEARRSGYRLRLLNASPRLRELVDLVGLAELLR